jgi:hypothetical protein
MLRHLAASKDHGEYCMQIYHVSEGYLRKIPVERRSKYPRDRYFSQITLTNRIFLFNSAEYLTASKTVACMQAGSELQTTSII